MAVSAREIGRARQQGSIAREARPRRGLPRPLYPLAGCQRRALDDAMEVALDGHAGIAGQILCQPRLTRLPDQPCLELVAAVADEQPIELAAGVVTKPALARVVMSDGAQCICLLDAHDR